MVDGTTTLCSWYIRSPAGISMAATVVSMATAEGNCRLAILHTKRWVMFLSGKSGLVGVDA
jgi:hypothetical protein